MKNLWANSSHIKSDHTNKTSARSWEVGLQSSGGNFAILSLVTLQFICQVCWSKFYRCTLRRRPLEEIYFEKRSYPQRCLIRLVFWESSDQISRQSVKFTYPMNSFKEGSFVWKRSRFPFLLSKFSHFFVMLTETQRRPAESQETRSKNTLPVAMK